MPAIDLEQLATRESEQIEWKENVANVDDVIETLCAFANDLANLGGGYVVCGAQEGKDEHGFAVLIRTGLTANRLKEVENQVLARCRARVSPQISPLIEELQKNFRRIILTDVYLCSYSRLLCQLIHSVEPTKEQSTSYE
jgi:ATP-dependent DNA helicase RecG